MIPEVICYVISAEMLEVMLSCDSTNAPTDSQAMDEIGSGSAHDSKLISSGVSVQAYRDMMGSYGVAALESAAASRATHPHLVTPSQVSPRSYLEAVGKRDLRQRPPLYPLEKTMSQDSEGKIAGTNKENVARHHQVGAAHKSCKSIKDAGGAIKSDGARDSKRKVPEGPDSSPVAKRRGAGEVRSTSRAYIPLEGLEEKSMRSRSIGAKEVSIEPVPFFPIWTV